MVWEVLQGAVRKLVTTVATLLVLVSSVAGLLAAITVMHTLTMPFWLRLLLFPLLQVAITFCINAIAACLYCAVNKVTGP
jgi:hypothetical protein